MGYTGKIPAKVPLTSDDIVDGSISNADLAGSITSAKITSLDATKLTGTVAPARMGSGTASSTTVLYGDGTYKAEPVTNTTSIEQFENSTYIENLSTAIRDTGEYVSSSTTVAPAYFTGNQQSEVTLTSNANIYNYTGSPNTALGFDQLFDGDTTSISSVHSFVFGTGTQPASGKYLRFQFASPAKLITEAKLYVGSTEGLGTWQWEGSNTGSFSGEETTIGSSFALGATAGGQALTELSGNTTYYTWYQMRGLSGTISDYPYVKEIEFKRGQRSTSATGSFNSTDVVPQDAVNKSSVGLVLLYKDNGSSSCTLNTDVIAKVRANTGQAYQTLVLAGAGTYSDSLKIAIAPAISVTAGQALSYEISFANQSSGTKEAHIYGVAMTY